MNVETLNPPSSDLEDKSPEVPAAKLAPAGSVRMDDTPWKEGRFGVVLLILFFGVLGSWAAFARLDAGAVARGYVVVSSNRQAVQHRDGGTVLRLYARDGDTVAAEQVLAKLDDTELRANVDSLTSQWIELMAMAARLKAEADGADSVSVPPGFRSLPVGERELAEKAVARQRSEYKARSQSVSARLVVLDQQIRQLEARIVGLEERILSTSSQKRLLEEELEGMQSLADKGLAPMTRVRALERSLAELEGDRGELLSSIAQAREAMTETNSEAIALKTGERRDVTRELRETEGRIADLIPRLDAYRAQLERTEIRAPAAGIVVGSSVFTEGGVIRPGETVMEIVPQGEPMRIDAQIRPEDVDDITDDLKAEVKFTGLSGRGLPIIYGYVESVSADRFVDESTGMAYFRIRLKVPEAELQKLREVDAGFVLKPGLPADILIPLRKRTALQYLFEPLTSSLWKSFREQ